VGSKGDLAIWTSKAVSFANKSEAEPGSRLLFTDYR
jgi:hypothetical protein